MLKAEEMWRECAIVLMLSFCCTLSIFMCANTGVCVCVSVCVITEKSIVLCAGIFLLSHSGLYGYSSHDSSLFVFCRNVGGGFIAYFNFLQKAFSENRNRWRERRERQGKEIEKQL